MMYEDYFKNIVGGNYDSPEYYTNANYSSYPTYRNEYEMYTNYENDMYSMDNEYNRFMPRQVNASPYNIGYQDDMNYIEVSNMYPEIYKKISPVLERVLANSDISNINNDVLDKMTFEIYDEVEASNENNAKSVNSNNVTEQLKSTMSNSSGQIRTSSMGKTSPSISTLSVQSNAKTVPSSTNNTKAMPSVGNNVKTIPSSSSSAKINSNEKVDTKEVVTTPRRNNTLLSDLIRILILNRIFGNQRPPFPGGRPPIGPSPRPPYPGSRPPRPNPNPRPPIGPGPRPPYPGNRPPRQGFRQLGNSISTNNVAYAPMDYFDVPYPEE